MKNWYIDRMFHKQPKKWLMLTFVSDEKSNRMESRIVGAVSFCCLRPIKEICPQKGGILEQIKIILKNRIYYEKMMMLCENTFYL